MYSDEDKASKNLPVYKQTCCFLYKQNNCLYKRQKIHSIHSFIYHFSFYLPLSKPYGHDNGPEYLYRCLHKGNLKPYFGYIKLNIAKTQFYEPMSVESQGLPDVTDYRCVIECRQAFINCRHSLAN